MGWADDLPRPSSDSDLLDATAQAELIASGRVSAAEVVAVAIDRAKSLETLGATTVLFEERARERAGTHVGRSPVYRSSSKTPGNSSRERRTGWEPGR